MPQNTLRVLNWPGYADADLVKALEARTGHKVNVPFIDSDKTLWQRVQQNKRLDFDVFAVNSADNAMYHLKSASRNNFAFAPET